MLQQGFQGFSLAEQAPNEGYILFARRFVEPFRFAFLFFFAALSREARTVALERHVGEQYFVSRRPATNHLLQA
jgi:hypothetical protein